MDTPVLARDYLKSFIDAGILPPLCCRMIIDLKHDSVVQVYYECLGDKTMLELVTPESLHGVVVIRAKDVARG